MTEFFIQAIGAIAYFLLALSYFEKEKKDILLMQIIALITFTLHYQFLNGITGAVCNLISAVTMLIMYFYEKGYKKRSKKLLVILIIPVVIAISIISYENIYSIFPILASIIMIFAFVLDNENHIRVLGLISNLLWTVYGVVYMSYFSIIFEVFAVITTSIAIYKYNNSAEK